ncbi:Rrf2 family transcriptional regulator [Selenomonas sp. TAMA-11512]|uniref:Rrf2 family transcriptional regulator n=1 Tax=Selenomonas sp. TAMA-11512 TaxID=3095337 RepID=UPI003085A1EE|nr:Rrf2 family transcriptional regulator [Selenomonas sp. TAMA-11512]
MQITSKFTIAVHMISAIDYFQDSEKVTSSFLAGSIGANPVIVRNVMGNLKEAGIIGISQGKSGIRLTKGLAEITFYDVYKAVDCVEDEGLFHFHENPNTKCPVGRNIHRAMDGKLRQVQDAMENELRHITIADVAADVKKEGGTADCDDMNQ